LKELVVLVGLFGFDCWSRIRSLDNPTWQRFQPERNANPLLTTGISPHHDLWPGKPLTTTAVQDADASP
jgi:hypothetical protein